MEGTAPRFNLIDGVTGSKKEREEQKKGEGGSRMLFARGNAQRPLEEGKGERGGKGKEHNGVMHVLGHLKKSEKGGLGGKK